MLFSIYFSIQNQEIYIGKVLKWVSREFKNTIAYYYLKMVIIRSFIVTLYILLMN